MKNFEIGDVVVLKSGGPSMTIERIKVYVASKTPYAAVCSWFDGTKRMTGEFILDTLQKATP